MKSGVGKSTASAGLVLLTTVTIIESCAASAKARTFKVPAVVESDLAPVNPAVPAVVASVNWLPAAPENTAYEGTELSTPRPKAATATSAMRLKFVFEDICFLSLVVTRNFLVAASR